tara:strand:+ start:2130 stop:3314 length:1185 start_codon:yes stop_codon:yes gene_type:complete
MREEMTTLGESCQFFNGKAHEKDIDAEGKYVVVNSKFISRDGKVRKFTGKQMFPLFEDDIVMVMSDVPNGKALAKCYIIEENDKYSLNQRICAIRTTEFDIRFLYYQLNRHPFLLAFNNGENQSNLRKGDILNCPLWKPEIEIQEQIVELLDDALEQIELANVTVEKNIENTSELFQSKLMEIFSIKNDNWEIKQINEICEVKDGTHASPKYVSEEKGIPFITQKNVLDVGLSFADIKHISKKDHEDIYKRSNVAYNDILFSMIGANRGMACIVDDERIFSIKNVGLIKASKFYRPKFLLFYFKSPIAQKYVKENSSGSAQGFIGLGKLRAFPVPLISIELQDEIITQLDYLNLSVSELIKSFELKLTNLEELKKSILQQAFAGELSKKQLITI